MRVHIYFIFITKRPYSLHAGRRSTELPRSTTPSGMNITSVIEVSVLLMNVKNR